MDELTLAEFYALFGDPPVLNLCNDEDWEDIDC